MKKIIISAVTFLFIAASGFTQNFFEHRFFEINANLPVQISNNYFRITDFQKNKELVIDLHDMADSLPASGYKIITSVKPQMGAQLSVGPVTTGVVFGMDLYGNIGIGKELFNFLGYGYDYEKDNDLNVDGDVTLDSFMTLSTPVTVDIRRIKCTFATNVFIPVIHGSASEFNVSMINESDGTFKIDGKGTVELYTGMDSKILFREDGSLNLTPALISGVITNAVATSSFGFDISGSFNYRFSDIYMLTTNFNIPLVPGRLNYKTPLDWSFKYETTIEQLMGGNPSSPDFSYAPGEVQNVQYIMHRPFRLNAGLEYNPFETKWLILNGMFGLAVRHPFSPVPGETVCYPEYNFSMTLNLASVLKATLSSSYTDQIFSQQFGIGLNIRLIEVRAGIATQSPTFAASFKGCGLGAYVNAAIGF